MSGSNAGPFVKARIVSKTLRAAAKESGHFFEIGANEVVDAEDISPHGFSVLLGLSPRHYLVLGMSPPPDPGKSRAEFKMKSSSEVT